MKIGNPFKKVKKLKKKIQKGVKNTTKKAQKGVISVTKTAQEGIIDTMNKAQKGLFATNRHAVNAVIDITKDAQKGVIDATKTAQKGVIDTVNQVGRFGRQTGRFISRIPGDLERFGAGVINEIGDEANSIERYVERTATNTIGKGEDYLEKLLGLRGNGSTDYFFGKNVIPFAVAAASIISGFYARNRGQYVVGSALIGGGVGTLAVDTIEGGINQLPLIGGFEFVKNLENTGLIGGYAVGAATGAGISLLADGFEAVETRAVSVIKSDEGKAIASGVGDFAVKAAPAVGAAALLL